MQDDDLILLDTDEEFDSPLDKLESVDAESEVPPPRSRTNTDASIPSRSITEDAGSTSFL